MLRVKVLPQLLEEMLTTDSTKRATRVLSGLPPGAKLDEAQFDGEVLELYFVHADHVGELTDVVVTVEAGEPFGWDSV